MFALFALLNLYAAPVLAGAVVAALAQLATLPRFPSREGHR